MVERTYMVIHTPGNSQHVFVCRCCTRTRREGFGRTLVNDYLDDSSEALVS